MFYKVIAASGLVFALSQGAAFAQSTGGQSSTSDKNDQSLPQEIKQKLSAQGFTSIEIVPGSYLISAKDKDGDPVTMVIGPHSMAVFTGVEQASSPGKKGNTK